MWPWGWRPRFASPRSSRTSSTTPCAAATSGSLPPSCFYWHLEDSEGRLTFTNAAFQVHLQTLLREVEELMAVQHMEVDDFFRPPPAAAGRGGGGESTATTVKWNGKSSASATATCHAFNGGRDHQADHLFPDGTCRYKHACDKWVSDQGPSNHCFGAHPRAACSNPNRCDAEQQ